MCHPLKGLTEKNQSQIETPKNNPKSSSVQQQTQQSQKTTLLQRSNYKRARSKSETRFRSNRDQRKNVNKLTIHTNSSDSGLAQDFQREKVNLTFTIQ